MNIWFLLTPLIIGGIIAAFNSEGLNQASENVESWFRKAYQNNSNYTGWFRRFIVRPILWLLVQFSDWTDSFMNRGLKNGVRIALTLYAIMLWMYILFAAFMFIMVIVIGFAIVYVVLKAIINSDNDFSKGYKTGRRVFGAGGSNTRVNPDTGVIQKEGLFGWNDTDQRIDPETGKYQKEGIFGWNDTGSKVDQDTGVVQKEGLFGYNDTDTRIDPETGIIQKQGMFGWQDTDRRIDPETGRHQKQGLLGWVDE